MGDEAVCEQGGRAAEWTGGQVSGQGAACGLRPGAALQPGVDGGGEAGHIPFGEQEPVVVAAQGCKERGSGRLPGR
ncbi:hypothetical protein ITI46_14380 [Streptomyces oryzae]|uniref:Uncharacterized protein n=1 Tax=Streptomyces oryzae TaxID=1434886 RepID=A0ABS3XBT9_9ACTN|nr:hypothetical protein [Streptomyces oryzae]